MRTLSIFAILSMFIACGEKGSSMEMVRIQPLEKTQTRTVS